jgi:hypothetical protein
MMPGRRLPGALAWCTLLLGQAPGPAAAQGSHGPMDFNCTQVRPGHQVVHTHVGLIAIVALLPIKRDKRACMPERVYYHLNSGARINPPGPALRCRSASSTRRPSG